jgi:hypothetical protein
MKNITLFVLLMTTACAGLTEPTSFTPAGATELATVPAEYASIWKEVDSCTGITRPMTSTFYSVPSAPDHVGFINQDGDLVFGQYEWETDRIFIVSPKLQDAATIRHEMIHAHLPANSGHPAEYFNPTSKCGALGV